MDKLRSFSIIVLALSLALSGFAGPQTKETGKGRHMTTALSQDGAARPIAMGRSPRPIPASIGKRPLWPWLLGGAVVLGIAAYFLFLKPERDADDGKRDVSVSSTPAGAAVFLDGAATGMQTNCLLKSVSAGAHVIRLEKDGYRDYEASFEVASGSANPVTLDILLEKAAIVVSCPTEGAIVEIGTTLPVRWAVDYQALAAADPMPSAQGLPQVRLELWKNGIRSTTIADSVANSGSYDWLIPTGQAAGQGWTVRVVCPSDEAIFGESPAFILASRFTRRYEGSTPPFGGFALTCSFESPIDVDDNGRIIGFSYQMKCYNETGVDIAMIAPSGRRLENPSYSFDDYVPTDEFDGLEMSGRWRLEVRDSKTPPERDDITIWSGWKIEITALAWPHD
jgi:hypothetical protein